MSRLAWSQLMGRSESDRVDPSIYRFFGFLFLLGFVLPVVNPLGGLLFLNFTILAEWPPADVFFLVAYPLLAAVGLLSMSVSLKGPARGVCMAVVGFLPVLLFLLDTAGPALSLLSARGEAGFFPPLLSYIGWTTLFASGFALTYQPLNRAALRVGAVGGAIYLAGLVVPQGGTVESVPIVAVLSLLSGSGFNAFVQAAGILAYTACMVAACVYSLAGAISRIPRPENGLKSYRLQLLAVAIFLGFLLLVVAVASSEMGGSLAVSSVSIILKLALWFGPALLLIPVGLADLLLELAAPPGETAFPEGQGQEAGDYPGVGGGGRL